MGYRLGKKVLEKRILYVNRHAPHGTIYALEGLEVILMGAAFEQPVSVLFLDDGVYQLARGQDPSALGMKNFAKGFRALELYDIKAVFVDSDGLERRGLGVDDLILPAEPLDRVRIAELMEAHDVILSF